MRQIIHGVKDKPRTTIEGASHTFQKNKGLEFANVVVDFMVETAKEKRAADWPPSYALLHLTIIEPRSG